MTTPAIQPRTRSYAGYFEKSFHTVHCTTWGAERFGPTVILLHGFMQNGREFDPLASALAEAGWRVFCPDFPGHGRSPWRADGEYRFGIYASTVAATITAAGAPSVHMVGGSMGGGIAMRMASNAGIPLRSLVLSDVSVHWPTPAQRRQAAFIPAKLEFDDPREAVRAVARFTSDRGPISDQDLAQVAQYSLKREADGSIRFRCDPRLRTSTGFLQLQAGDGDRSQAWQAVPVPTLLIRGQNSNMLEAGTADRMIAMNPRSELLTIPDAGHPPWLRQPSETGPVVAWMARQAEAERSSRAAQPGRA